MALQREAGMSICAICAWRETCQKKFTVSGKDIRCPEFVRDISIKEPSEKAEEKKPQKG